MRLVHEGFSFLFDGPRELLASVASLGDDAGPSGEAQPGAPSPALIPCRLHALPQALSPKELARAEQPSSEYASERGWLSWEWAAGEGHVRTRTASAHLWQEPSTAAFTAEAWLPPERRAARTLMGGLCSVILHALGGLIAHASSVVRDGSVIAFLGPSGAGKSTASRQTEGASLFSVDRLALAPGTRAWWAYPLAGGTLIDLDMPHAARSWLPLAGLVRVHQASSGARLETCSPITTLAILRESSLHGGRGAGVESDFLSRLEQLAARVPVARLHFGFGTPLTPTLSRWLSGTPCE